MIFLENQFTGMEQIDREFNIRTTSGLSSDRLPVIDIFEHMPVLKRFAEECESIVEFGVRYANSTIAFLAAKPKKMLSVDNVDAYPILLNTLSAIAKEAGVDFTFVIEDSRTIDIPETDLLFIDTEHTAEQLRAELKNAAHKVKKYMIFHDTVTFPELYPVLVDEFLPEHPEWTIKEHLTNNNGLTVLMRI